MARRLSNPEYAAFLSEMQPDNLGLPDWGGIVDWDGTGQYIMMFKMPSGEWALTDVSDGIPYGSTVIPITTYLQNVPKYQVSWLASFFYSLPASVAASTLQAAAGAGALATQGLQVTEDQIAQALAKILGGAAGGLQPIAWPLAAIAVVLIMIMYGRKG